MCHTAHRTSTSRTAWQRLCKILTDSGYAELDRRTKEAPEKSFHSTKANGLEAIELTGGGSIVFRTRTANGGLGEGFDLLVIDEAQEYTEDQESALIYTVSDSSNPQTIFCGTPPTTTSVGTVFNKMRSDTLAGDTFETGWAEWSVDKKPADITDVDLWYETNPSMGFHLDERKVRSEIRGDELDFIIQRLGYWFRYSLKSAITEAEWLSLKSEKLPELTGGLHVGIKYGHDNINVAVSIAVRTKAGGIFVETIDCRPIRGGNDWIIEFLQKADVESVIVDGQNGNANLATEMKDFRMKAPIMPTVKEVISACAMFETALTAKSITHMAQPSLVQSVSNCEHRAISSNGGFGYRSIRDDVDVTLMESMVLAHYACSNHKPKRRQQASY